MTDSRVRRNRTAIAALAIAVLVVTVGLVATSGGSAASLAAPVNQSPPTISGTAQEGMTLTASSGSWSGAGTISYSYQWRRCDNSGGSCSGIGGATSSTYTLKRVDVDNTLRVRVTARNADGSAQATSAPTAVVTAATPAPAPTGCPAGSGAIDIAGLSAPARLLIDGLTSSPAPVTRSTSDLTVRFHVSACSGRSVTGALVYVTAVPFEQFSIPAETPTDESGWATLTLHQAGRFPASPRQQILALFVRARKPGESVLGGIAARRLMSVRVSLG